jgi:hypothetical protein
MATRTRKHAADSRKKLPSATQRVKKAKKSGPQSKRRPAKHEKRLKTLEQPCCGLCGATANLIKTDCCGQWICDDEDQYQLFSYARNSCHRNHQRYTLCGYHFNEQHPGRWQDCPKCREEIDTEMYVYYGTNEYNFEVLNDPPAFEPTCCTSCGRVIVLADGGYSYGSDGHRCDSCTAAKFANLFD